MRRILPLLALLLLPLAVRAQERGLSVRTDPRVELLAIVWRLAGSPEYNRGRVPGYNRAIDEHFAPFREHPAVQEAKRLRAARGVSYDAVMSMAVHLDDADSPAGRRAFTAGDPSLETRWTPADAARFPGLLADFVREARFGEFMAAQQATLDSARVRMQRVVDANLDVPRIEKFFGRTPNGAFIMVPLVANGEGNFGVRYLEGDREEVYAIIGVSADGTGMPVFNTSFVPTMVHEFSHSFVNPAVTPVADRFEEAGVAIYPRVEAQMRSQAYSNWLTMINESLVRASVARYLLATSGEAAAKREIAAQRARGFYWTDELYELLGEYERERARYPSLDRFLPRVAEYFDTLVPRLDGRIAEFDAARPRLVSSEPADGATGVDPALDRIVLRFDQPMGPGVNGRVGPAGREHFPPVTKVAWDASGTTLTLFVTLKPAWQYELLLGGGFVTRAARVPLKDTLLRFSTR